MDEVMGQDAVGFGIVGAPLAPVGQLPGDLCDQGVGVGQTAGRFPRDRVEMGVDLQQSRRGKGCLARSEG
ncbi:hypothetical protein ACFOHS_11525 [Jhaorihella thermophila]